MYLVNSIPPNAKQIVEFGCQDGSFAEMFKTINPYCKYIGVEKDMNLAQKALEKIEQVFVGSIVDTNLSQLGVQDESLDCLIYHNIEDWDEKLIDQFKQNIIYLKDDGQIILDFPNRTYINNILTLFQKDIVSNRKLLSLQYFKQLCRDLGLFISNLMPYYLQADEVMKKDSELSAAIGVLKKRCKIENNDSFIKGYIIRIVKQPVQPLLIQSMLGEIQVCARVRIIEPNNFCATLPNVKIVSDAFKADLSIGGDYKKKVFISQRIDQPVDRIQQLIKKGYLIISEIDDDPEHWEHYRQSKYFNFRGCHGVQTSTPALAKYLKQFNPNVAVFENQIRELAPLKEFEKKAKVTMFFGALNRENDWQKLMPILNEILLKHENEVVVKVIHDKKFFAELKIQNKEYIPFCPYEQYVKTLRSSDIALLPLEDTHFNQMKSDLKFIESAAHGVAVLASPCVYQDTIKNGRTGYIYHNMEEFREYLTILIENEEVRRDMVVDAYDFVKKNRLLSMHYAERYNWYVQLLEKLPRLNQEMYARTPELR